eukprot:4426447-Lingulodinium_polyedra.AAC.1
MLDEPEGGDGDVLAIQLEERQVEDVIGQGPHVQEHVHERVLLLRLEAPDLRAARHEVLREAGRL